MLNPDVDGRFDKGFEVFMMTFSSATEATVSAFFSYISWDCTGTGILTSCFSSRNGANIINFFFLQRLQ